MRIIIINKSEGVFTDNIYKLKVWVREREIERESSERDREREREWKRDRLVSDWEMGLIDILNMIFDKIDKW